MRANLPQFRDDRIADLLVAPAWDPVVSWGLKESDHGLTPARLLRLREGAGQPKPLWSAVAERSGDAALDRDRQELPRPLAGTSQSAVAVPLGGTLPAHSIACSYRWPVLVAIIVVILIGGPRSLDEDDDQDYDRDERAARGGPLVVGRFIARLCRRPKHVQRAMNRPTTGED